MEIYDKVKHTIQKYCMVSQGDNVLVGLSGGHDSVCLTAILNNLKPELGFVLSAAYIDHGLRPDETPHEIEFCRDLCDSLEIPFFVKHVDVKACVKEKRLNKQEAARDLRYKAFDEIAAEAGANKIAVAHNANDQAETLLIRLFRGTGPAGLSGMPPVRRHIIRPLIEIERSEIERFLESEGIGFVIDSSNLGNEYLRNKIRHLMIPVIKNTNSDVIKTLSRTADILRDEERYFEIQVTKALMKLITRKNDKAIELFLGPLEAMDTVILRRILRRAIDATNGLRGIGFIHIEEIISLIKSGRSGDRIYLPKEIRVIKGYATLIITSEKPLLLGTYLMEGTGDLVLKEASKVIRSSVINADEMGDFGDLKDTAFIDADKARFPLTVRSRISGDYFFPLGFGKRKKLQDYFVDEKIPRDERDSLPLLTCGDDIVWVMGYRLDDRYKVDKDTKRVIKFEIKPLKF